MSDIKIQNFLMNHYADRIKSVNPNDSKTANTKYIDLNNNGRKDAGELLSENANSDEFLKHIIYRENDVIKMKYVYEKVTAANTRTNALQNELESKLILKAALMASEVPEEKIPEYVEKFDRLYAGYIHFKQERNLKPLDKFQEIGCLNKYLWKNGQGQRATQTVAEFYKSIDNQLDYLNDVTGKVTVGSCVGLTMLFNVMAVRAGIPVQSVIIPEHVFSLYQGRVIENTNFHGINDAKYSVDNIVHAYNAISFEYFNVAKFHFDRKEYDKAIEVLEKSIKLDPNNSGTRPALVTVYSKVGFDHAAKKEYDLAIKAYKRAIDLNPENSRVYNNLGVVYGDKKEWDKAIHAYEQAIRFDRKDPLPHINLTYARFQKLISLSK